MPDLLIAATAELHVATLLHYDRHFDLIVWVTGQPAEWLAPRGALDRVRPVGAATWEGMNGRPHLPLRAGSYPSKDTSKSA